MTLYPIYQEAGTLRFHPTTRAYGSIFWLYSPPSDAKDYLKQKIRSLGHLRTLAKGNGHLCR